MTRMLQLPYTIQSMVEDKTLDMGHARCLLGIKSTEVQHAVAKNIAKAGLSVRATEKLINKINNNKNKAKDKKPELSWCKEIHELRKKASQQLNAQFTIKHFAKGDGSIAIKFDNLDECHRILSDLLKIEENA